jgi:hypothetical protein
VFNAKQYVRSILSDPGIINLTGGKTVHFIHANSPVAPYVEYLFYDENGAAWEEGKEISTDYFLQIDIFSKGSYSDLENKIKEKLMNVGFERDMAADLYESDTQLFHKAMRFIFTS